MATNQTLLSIVAIAGNKDAAHHAAMSDLQRGIAQMVKHGNKNPLTDTRDALATLGKAARVVNVREMVESAIAAAGAEFATHKRANPDADGAVARILDACVAAYDKVEADGAATRKAAAEKTKAEKAKAQAAQDRAAKSVAPLAQALSIADALALIAASCAAGDEQALTGLQTLAETYFDAVTA